MTQEFTETVRRYQIRCLDIVVTYTGVVPKLSNEMDRGAPPHGARREWNLRHLVLPVIWANSPVAIFHLED